MSAAIKPSNFTASKLSVRPPKVLESGAKAVSLDYEGRPLILQTPSMQLPYGLSVYDKSKPFKYSYDLSYRGSDEDAKIKELYDAAQAFDNHMIDLAMQNAQTWFKLSNPSREVITAFYTPMIKVPRDKDGNIKPYPPTTKITLKQQDGVFQTQFYDPTTLDKNGRPTLFEGVPVEELLVKSAKATSLIQCTGIWIAPGKFGTTWKALQVRVDSVPERISGYGFRDDDEAIASKPATQKSTNHFNALQYSDDEEESKTSGSVLDAVMPKPAAAAAAPTFTDDSDDDGDEVAAPVPVPVKKPTKAPLSKPAPKKVGTK